MSSDNDNDNASKPSTSVKPGVVAAAESPSGIKEKQQKLPAGWICQFSKSQQLSYYFNTATGKSQWHLPIENPSKVTTPKKRSLDQMQSNSEDSSSKPAKRAATTTPNAHSIATLLQPPAALPTDTNTPKTTPVAKVAILVPFRDSHASQSRAAHLAAFIPHMEKFLSHLDIASFGIFIIEQSDDGKKFNRGKLLNVAFDLTKDDFNTFIFHDVDLLPAEDLGAWYSTVPKPCSPVHIARVWDRYSNNKKYFGGIVAFSQCQFEKINGYPNTFWGWGGEDDELYNRVQACDLKIVYPKIGTITDMEEMDLKTKLSVLKKTDWKCMVKWELLKEHQDNWSSNGLSSLSYTEISRKSLGSYSTKITVSLGLNNHWSDTKTSWKD